MHRTAILLVVLGLLAGASLPAQAGGGLVAHLYANGHHPKVGKPFPIRFTATDRSGRPIRATVDYQYLFGGQVVARKAHHAFKGSFRDALVFPAASVGYHLVFRGVIKSAIGRTNLDWWVEVRR